MTTKSKKPTSREQFAAVNNYRNSLYWAKNGTDKGYVRAVRREAITTLRAMKAHGIAFKI